MYFFHDDISYHNPTSRKRRYHHKSVSKVSGGAFHNTVEEKSSEKKTQLSCEMLDDIGSNHGAWNPYFPQYSRVIKADHRADSFCSFIACNSESLEMICRTNGNKKLQTAQKLRIFASNFSAIMNGPFRAIH